MTASINVGGREKESLQAFQIGRTEPLAKRSMTMPDHVYRIIQVAGSSEKSIEDAIQIAVGRASRTLRQVGWFEVVETRGHVDDGKVAHYQVTLKVGFTLDDDD
jgi:dodecin